MEKFLKQDICPDCKGSRLSAVARTPLLCGISLDKACKMPLGELAEWVNGIPSFLNEEMRPMAQSICEAFQSAATRLIDLGLSYLSLDRAASTLSTGERQRMQLARAVRNRTTGVLYVLDEPSIGLHPSNIIGLNGVMRDLVADGNSVILVDHETQILSALRAFPCYFPLKEENPPTIKPLPACHAVPELPDNSAETTNSVLAELLQRCRPVHTVRRS